MRPRYAQSPFAADGRYDDSRVRFLPSPSPGNRIIKNGRLPRPKRRTRGPRTTNAKETPQVNVVKRYAVAFTVVDVRARFYDPVASRRHAHAHERVQDGNPTVSEIAIVDR